MTTLPRFRIRPSCASETPRTGLESSEALGDVLGPFPFVVVL